MAAIPTCTPIVHVDRQVQTFVAKVSGVSKSTLAALAQAIVVTGEGGVAVVDTGDVSRDPGLFLVVTFAKPWTATAGLARLKNQILKVPGDRAPAPDILYIRPFTRRLQRLFHWGDAHTKRADVEKSLQRGGHGRAPDHHAAGPARH